MGSHYQREDQWCRQGRYDCVWYVHMFVAQQDVRGLGSDATILFMRSSMLRWGCSGGPGGLDWVFPSSCSLDQRIEEVHTSSELAGILVKNGVNWQTGCIAMRERQLQARLSWVILQSFLLWAQEEGGVNCQGWDVSDFVFPLMGLGYITLRSLNLFFIRTRLTLIMCISIHDRHRMVNRRLPPKSSLNGHRTPHCMCTENHPKLVWAHQDIHSSKFDHKRGITERLLGSHLKL